MVLGWGLMDQPGLPVELGPPGAMELLEARHYCLYDFHGGRSAPVGGREQQVVLMLEGLAF